MNAKLKAVFLCSASVLVGVAFAVDDTLFPNHKIVDRCAVSGSEECSIAQPLLVSNPTLYFNGELIRSGNTSTTTAAF